MNFNHKPTPSNRSGNRTIGKLFWGLLIIGTAVLLLLNAIFPDGKLPIIKIIGSVLLLAIAVASLTRFRFIFFFLPLAIVALIWRTNPLLYFLRTVDPWLLLLVALLLGIGLSLIFHRKSYVHVNIGGKDGAVASEDAASRDEVVNIDVNFGEHIKHVYAENLRDVQIKSHFASAKIYLNSCTAGPEGVTININCSFSDLALDVPRTWAIDNRISTFAGEIRQSSPPMEPVDKAPVKLTGSVNFAQLKINFI
ncbi:MAG: hypothetical protein GX276_00625 [Clostridiaceae bacterium]|jgi:predicted membrane protein|nr:hypothetical protein [Clostridiaceae bacterium]